jgi:hypothetical protein
VAIITSTTEGALEPRPLTAQERVQVVAERRYARVTIDPALIVALFKAHDGRRYFLNTRDALPDDAFVVSWRGVGMCVEVLLGSPSFAPVPEGDAVPTLTPEVQVTFVEE